MAFNTDHALETYKSLISIGVEVLKSLLLLNGGAIVALLAYMGQASNGTVVAKNSTCSLAWFIAGLVLSALAFLGAYLTQLALYNETVHSETYKGSHGPYLWVSITVAFFSIVAFAIGSFVAVSAFSQSAT